jgi:hypothetical protein
LSRPIVERTMQARKDLAAVVDKSISLISKTSQWSFSRTTIGASGARGSH